MRTRTSDLDITFWGQKVNLLQKLKTFDELLEAKYGIA